MVRHFVPRPPLAATLGRHSRQLVPFPSTSSPGQQHQQQLPKGLPKRMPRFIEPLWLGAIQQGLNKDFADGQAHITSVDFCSQSKAIARLSLPPKAIQNAYVQKLHQMPIEAVEAMGGLIQDAKLTPRQLQNDADVLSNQLEVRHFPFPPQAVRQTRAEIIKELLEKNPAFIYELNTAWKNRPALDSELSKLVQRRLASRRYNWKPLSFKKKEQALAYALSRFPSHYAEMRRVLSEFDRNGFVPEKVLDYGSGVGSAFWAAFERWGDKVKEYALVDSDQTIRHFSMDLLRGRNYSGSSSEMVSRNLFFRKQLFPSPQHTYDLVILHRTLIEMPSHEERVRLLEKLWKRTNKYLVVVDSPMNDAFIALMKLRDHLVTGGYDFDEARTKELLYDHGKLDQDTIELFADRKVELYQKYCRARELLPENVKIPTRLEAGHVFAPCPHDRLCPMMALKKPCRFVVRWQEFRADHRTRSARRDGTERGRFSFLIFAKGERPKGAETQPRILELERYHHCVSCKACTPGDGIQEFVVSKRASNVYKRIRRAESSQLLPVQFELVRTEAEQLQKIREAGYVPRLTGPIEVVPVDAAQKQPEFRQLAIGGRQKRKEEVEEESWPEEEEEEAGWSEEDEQKRLRERNRWMAQRQKRQI